MNEQIKAHLMSCDTRFGCVVFRKKDGSVRRLTFQLAAGLARVKGTAEESYEVRKTNFPNLFPVWDIHAGAFRNVNLDTVFTVKANGVTTRYRNL